MREGGSDNRGRLNGQRVAIADKPHSRGSSVERDITDGRCVIADGGTHRNCSIP